jgi:enoyl-CoA hydratase/carnithine racemase
MPNLSQTPKLQLVSDSEIAWIIADNPPRMNALTAEMWKALPHLLAEAEGDDAIRVVVLRGAGERAFSTGADISEFESARTGAKAVEYDSLNHAAFSTLSACTKPTISMIHGFCLGGGLGLALATDIRLADAKAEFSGCQAWTWLQCALGSPASRRRSTIPCEGDAVHWAQI